MRRHNSLRNETHKRRFHATFGTTPAICAMLWEKLDPACTMPKGSLPVHLLWALMFMKLYCSEAVHSSMAGVDEKTFRKWTWILVDGISYLEAEVVS